MSKFLTKTKTALFHIVLYFVGWVSKFIPLGLMQLLLGIFAYTPLRGLVYNVWKKILLRAGHRFRQIKWSDTFAKRCRKYYLFGTKQNIFALYGVLDRLRVGDLQCAELFDATRNKIYAEGDAKNYQFLQVVGSIYQIEMTQSIGQKRRNISGELEAHNYFQYRMERAHAMRNEPAVDLYARAYCAAVEYAPHLVARICERTLSVNNLHETAIELLRVAAAKVDYSRNELVPNEGGDPASVRGFNAILNALHSHWNNNEHSEHLTADLEFQMADHLLELKRYDEVEILIDQNYEDERFKSIRAKQFLLTNELQKSEQVLNEIVEGVRDPEVKSDRLGELAVVCEEQRKFEDALALYRASYHAAPTDSLNIARSASWRYVSALMALGNWLEARALLRETQVYMWRFFKSFLSGRSSYQKVVANDFRLPETGGLILGCWGIGDELFRMGIWHQLANKKAKWALTCEPRLESVFKRSFPDLEIIPNSRTRGPHSVPERTYWEEREGLPANTDFGRITGKSIAAMKRYNNVLISEVFLYEFVSRGGQIEHPIEEPALTIDPVEQNRVEDWLTTLPPGINVAISWRSGFQSSTRDKNYTQLSEWGEILSLPGINFINIQYSDREEEKNEVRRLFNANIHEMPDVDRKHDVETILAICKCCDIVIAPCTAVREMAGSVGAKTWSLTTTPYLPDLWRISEDGFTDKIFPTIRHFTSRDHDDKHGVLKAIAKELASLSFAASTESVAANAE